MKHNYNKNIFGQYSAANIVQFLTKYYFNKYAVNVQEGILLPLLRFTQSIVFKIEWIILIPLRNKCTKNTLYVLVHF